MLAIPPLPWATQPNSGSAPNQGTNLPTQNPSGRLREVEPPGAVQQLHQAFAKHHPQLSLISPLDGSQLKGGPLNLELKIEDWPLANDSHRQQTSDATISEISTSLYIATSSLWQFLFP